jgi:hypothetical protein
MDSAISRAKIKTQRPAAITTAGPSNGLGVGGYGVDGIGRGEEHVVGVWRLTIAACVLTYIVVFLVALQTGSAPDAATLKGGVAMAAIGVLGSIAISTVGSDDNSKDPNARNAPNALNDLSAPNDPNDPNDAGDSLDGGADRKNPMAARSTIRSTGTQGGNG